MYSQTVDQYRYKSTRERSRATALRLLNKCTRTYHVNVQTVSTIDSIDIRTVRADVGQEF